MTMLIEPSTLREAMASSEEFGSQHLPEPNLIDPRLPPEAPMLMPVQSFKAPAGDLASVLRSMLSPFRPAG